MAIAIYANKSFQVSSNKIYTFDGLELSASLQVEKQDVKGKKPSTYIKGTDLYELNFNIPLNASKTINIRREYESWLSILESEIPYYFILGGKPVGRNKYLLINAALSGTTEDNKGNILKGNIQIQLQEYVRPGSENETKEVKKKKKAAPAKKKKETTPKNVDVTSQILALSNKSLQKRDNKNVATAVAKGKKGR